MLAKGGLAFLGVLGVVAACAVPAQGTVIEHYAFEDVPYESGVDPEFPDQVICGITVHIEGVASFRGRVRAGKGKRASAFFVHERFSYVETWSANGKTVTVSGDGSFTETRAERVSGNVFLFEVLEAGQPFRLYDAGGNLLLRDRGSIRRSFLFDTLGDDIVGGRFVSFVDERVSGPHPGFFDETLCPVLVPLLSADA